MTNFAVLFDLDGTVLDTPKIILNAFGKVLQARGHAMDPVKTRRTIGKPLRNAFIQLMPNEPASTITECIQEFRDTFKEETIAHVDELVFPECTILISQLKRRDVKIAAVTSKIRSSAEEILDLTGILDLFDGLYCHDMVINGKPAPDLAILAMEQLAVAAGDSIVVGDSVDDITMAKKAGIQGIPVTWGVTSAAEFTAQGIDEVVKTWAALDAKIHQLLDAAETTRSTTLN